MTRKNPIRRRKLPRVNVILPKPVVEPQRAPEGPQRELVVWRRWERAWAKIKPKIVPALVLTASMAVQPKQTILIMLEWIRQRSKEPSTYKGITAILGVVGYQLDPQAFEIIVAVVLAVIGAIDFFQDEGKILTKKKNQAAKK